MSPKARTRREVGWRIWQQIPLLLALIVLWMLLWGEFTWLAFASGVLLALLVTRVFYLPAVELSGRYNVFWIVVFFGYFFSQLFVASFQVAWLAIRPRPPEHNAVLAVDLVTRTDFITTAVSLTITLIPGSFVMDVDREHSILYLHVLSVGDMAHADAFRLKVLGIERLLVRAVGSADDVRRTRA